MSYKQQSSCLVFFFFLRCPASFHSLQNTAAIDICAKFPTSTYWPASSSIFSSACSSPLTLVRKHKHWNHYIWDAYSCQSALVSNQKPFFSFLFLFLSFGATGSSFHYKCRQSQTEECCNWAWFYHFPQHYLIVLVMSGVQELKMCLKLHMDCIVVPSEVVNSKCFWERCKKPCGCQLKLLCTCIGH